jgi:hypothetical protein
MGFADITQELFVMECCGMQYTHAEVTENWVGIRNGRGNNYLVVRKCPNPYCFTNKDRS